MPVKAYLASASPGKQDKPRLPGTLDDAASAGGPALTFLSGEAALPAVVSSMARGSPSLAWLREAVASTARPHLSVPHADSGEVEFSNTKHPQANRMLISASSISG